MTVYAATAGNLESRIADAIGDRRDELADLGRDFDRMITRLHALVRSRTWTRFSSRSSGRRVERVTTDTVWAWRSPGARSRPMPAASALRIGPKVV
jgi:hypothetical protein